MTSIFQSRFRIELEFQNRIRKMSETNRVERGSKLMR